MSSSLFPVVHSAGDKLPTSILKISRLDFTQNQQSLLPKKNVNFDTKEQQHPYFVDNFQDRSALSNSVRKTLGNISNQISTSDRNQNKKKNRFSDYKSPKKGFFISNNIFPINQMDQLVDNDAVCEKLQRIFFELDIKKVGYIDKANCNIEQLPDDLKYLFGALISKIRYQGVRLTKNEFMNEANRQVSTMQENQIKLLLRSEEKERKTPSYSEYKKPSSKSASSSHIKFQKIAKQAKFKSCRDSKVSLKHQNIPSRTKKQKQEQNTEPIQYIKSSE